MTQMTPDILKLSLSDVLFMQIRKKIQSPLVIEVCRVKL